jgi:hypothetical protein
LIKSFIKNQLVDQHISLPKLEKFLPSFAEFRSPEKIITTLVVQGRRRSKE